MSFTTSTSASPTSTLSRTTSASTTTTLESAAPLTPSESTLDKFQFPFDAPVNLKTICASPQSLDDLWTSGSTQDNHTYARALLPAGFTFPTLSDVRSKTPVPYRDPFVNCRTSEDFRAVDALAAVHFAALKVQQTRERHERETRERRVREEKAKKEREERKQKGKEREKTQRKMFEDAWMCAKGAMSVVLVSGSVLCVLALA